MKDRPISLNGKPLMFSSWIALEVPKITSTRLLIFWLLCSTYFGMNFWGKIKLKSFFPKSFWSRMHYEYMKSLQAKIKFSLALHIYWELAQNFTFHMSQRRHSKRRKTFIRKLRKIDLNCHVWSFMTNEFSWKGR